jgi:hypothetical protein
MIHDLKNTYPGRLDVVEYNDLLGSPIYLNRRNNRPVWAFTSSYLAKPTTKHNPYFKWVSVKNESGGETGFIEQIDKYIIEKWDRTKNGSLPQLQKEGNLRENLS